jgi:acetyl-CoA carboxylase biotin carboxylase subunit
MRKILIANRGEIALRVIKTARKMGIATVAVYSDADRGAPHVKYADEAIHIGPSPSAQSYLDMDKILDAATRTGADAIHPGYGFLSENADFAERVAEAGLIFIGPSPESISMMGNKLAAKEAVLAYDIPMVPGTDTAVDDPEEANRIALEIGFPILIKAAAGGGGKGMRIVHRAADVKEQMERAISEARSSFGDGSVFIEKYIESPRHIEVQVLSDNHGNHLYLFERECSIQRRHQKVIEEAPSSVLTPELRSEMGKAAVRVAKSCDYSGAGTVEFLLDANRRFYFLEMNTRLQVEHPVTEMITGIDLVEEQIRIARGEALRFDQEDLSINGHAIELRVYAEDPFSDFMPSVGKLTHYERPSGEGVRVDDGYEEGMDIPIYYDPMIAKLIAWAPSREEALSRMVEAIGDYRIDGPKTTLPFGVFVMDHPAFISGKFDTHFVSEYFTPELLESQERPLAEIAAKLAVGLYEANSEAIHLPKHNGHWIMRAKPR